MAKVYTDLNVKELTGNKGLVVFFYPRAFAGPCSLEVHQFNNKLDDIKKLGFNVVGISVNTVDENTRFGDEQGLNYPLIADSTQKVTKSFDDLGQINRDGKDLTVSLRTTYILDPTGKQLAKLEDVQPISAATSVIDEIKNLIK